MAFINRFNELNLTLLMRSRKHLVSAVALGLAAVILLALSVSQISAIFETNRQLSREQEKIQQLNIKAQALEELKFSPEFAQAARINEVLPSKKPLLELLNNLNSVANETQVVITEFQVNPGEIATDSTQVSPQAAAQTRQQNTDYDQLDLALTIVGDLGQVRRFMDLIERVSPLTTITNLIIDRKVSQSLGLGENLTRADLALSTYYYTKSISAALSAPLPTIASTQSEIFQAILDFTPSELEEQTTIISGTQSDLFGIEGLTVQALQEALAIEEPGPAEATESAGN